ncbi:MAG: hypothetical protein E7678_08235 [Ruminococcaceae bacterium]|nr:hypothetical protein [Oscillospiraceae bacterium]
MSRVWVGIKRFWKIFGFLCGCIVLVVCVFMLWRVFSTKTPKELDRLTPNEKLLSVYSEQGESMYMFKQNQDIITRAEYNSGYFAIPDYTFIPDANQLQLVFRYNNSTLKSVSADKGLSEVLDRDGDYFDVSIVLYIDLTPDNPDDNEFTASETIKKIRCKGHVVGKDKTTLYNFYRYVFYFDEAEEFIDIKELMEGDSLIAIHAQFYYNDGLDYNEAPYGALLLYNPEMKNIQVELSSKDKKALGE